MALALLRTAAIPVLAALAGLYLHSARQGGTAVEGGGAARLVLRDGRELAYHVHGNLSSAKHLVLWNHGVISSRLESTATAASVLDELSVAVVGIDRPGYGQSTQHRDRTYESFAADLEQLADALGARRFCVAGVSGGGPYALAAAALLPSRVRSVLLLSSPCPAGALLPAEEAEFEAEAGPHHAIASWVRRHPGLVAALAAASKTPLGGAALFHGFLKRLAQGSPHKMAEVDRRCLEDHHPQHMAETVPEALRQASAAPFFQDLALFVQPWSFDLGAVPQGGRHVHVWHGTGDRQVPVTAAKVIARLLPRAQLRIVEGGGHFAFYACDRGAQLQALQALIAHE